MPAKLQPAFWGGLFIGVLSGLPYIGDLNACCCLWVVVGGVLTAYLLQERTPIPITVGQAAMTGLGAGALGAVIYGVLSTLVSIARGGMAGAFDQMPADMPPQMVEVFERLRSLPPSAWYLLAFVFALIVFPIFSMLGAMLGAAIFKKRMPPQPPVTIDVPPTPTV
jgi:hypothetical protein